MGADRRSATHNVFIARPTCTSGTGAGSARAASCGRSEPIPKRRLTLSGVTTSKTPKRFDWAFQPVLVAASSRPWPRATFVRLLNQVGHCSCGCGAQFCSSCA